MPYNQLPSESALRIEDALRARTRNVAWNASSAACASPSTSRQTRSTRGPYRSTSDRKAASATASSLRVAKRSSSCPSVIPPTTPTWNKVWNGLAAADSLSVMETPLDRS